MSLLAKAGDGQFGLDGKRSTEFGARRVEPAEMRQRDDLARIPATVRGWSCKARSAHSIACSKRRATR